MICDTNTHTVSLWRGGYVSIMHTYILEITPENGFLFPYRYYGENMTKFKQVLEVLNGDKKEMFLNKTMKKLLFEE